MFGLDETYSSTIPVYNSKSEVLKAANQNSCYFDSLGDSLRNAWKFYNKP